MSEGEIVWMSNVSLIWKDFLSRSTWWNVVYACSKGGVNVIEWLGNCEKKNCKWWIYEVYTGEPGYLPFSTPECHQVKLNPGVGWKQSKVVLWKQGSFSMQWRKGKYCGSRGWVRTWLMHEDTHRNSSSWIFAFISIVESKVTSLQPPILP